MDRSSALTTAQRRALARLSKAGLLEDVYLAGGAAVAQHLGHRRSNDLDLFSTGPDLDLEELRGHSVALGAETVSQSTVTLKLRLSGTLVDVVRYPYALVGRRKPGPEGVMVASLRDLAAMKLSAIAKRGVRRDYWDLYEIFTGSRATLRGACEDYTRKFGVAEADLYHVLRALTWFEDAEADPTPPRGLTARKWRDIRGWFEKEAGRELLRRTGRGRTR